jgi:hypothetical protein
MSTEKATARGSLSERERSVYRRARNLGIRVQREKGWYRYDNYAHEVSGRTNSLDTVERTLDFVAAKKFGGNK